MENKKTSFICPMAWLATGVCSPGYLRLCCNSDEHSLIREDNGKIADFLDQGSVQTYYNNEYMRKTRQEMMKGEVPLACRRCKQMEDTGLESPRIGYLNTYASEIDEVISATSEDGTVTPRIRYIDFALGNKCNLKCRMCIPEVAYGIARDWEAMGIQYNKEHTALGRAAGNSEVDDKFRNYFSEVLHDVKEIQFTSGEPLLSQHHSEILRLATELNCASEMTLIYFTNLTSIPEAVLEAWKSFKKVNIYVSLEAVGELNNYIRYPSKWEVVSSNIVKLLSFSENYPHISVEINTVFQAYNVLGISDLVRFLIPFAAKMTPIPHFNFIGHPNFLQPTLLPKEIKLKAKESIESIFEEYPWLVERSERRVKELLQHVENMMTTDSPELVEPFLYYTKNLDKLRNQQLSDILPEFTEMMTTASDS